MEALLHVSAAVLRDEDQLSAMYYCSSFHLERFGLVTSDVLDVREEIELALLRAQIPAEVTPVLEELPIGKIVDGLCALDVTLHHRNRDIPTAGSGTGP